MTDTAEATETVRPPRTIQAAFAVTIAHVVLSIANSAILWGFQDYLRKQLIKSNNKAKKPKDYSTTPQGLHNLNHDLHSGLNVGLIQIIIFSFLIMLLAWNFRKGRGWARWAEILVLIIVVQAPFRLFSLGGDSPIVMRVLSALVGLTGVAIIVLLLLPESTRYFAAVRGATAGDRASGAAVPGFRDLFRMGRPTKDETAPARGSLTRPNQPARVGRPVAKPADAKPAAKPDAQPAQPVGRAAAPAESKATSAAKAKGRAGSEAASASTSRPATSVAAKNRGKSRRGS